MGLHQTKKEDHTAKEAINKKAICNIGENI
jgi:hypothetical protein